MGGGGGGRICRNCINDRDVIFLKYVKIYIYIIGKDEENFIIFLNIILIGSKLLMISI